MKAISSNGGSRSEDLCGGWIKERMFVPNSSFPIFGYHIWMIVLLDQRCMFARFCPLWIAKLRTSMIIGISGEKKCN